MSNSPYSAKGPMAGYLYQCRLALLQGIRLAKTKPNARISIEQFDDVAFEDEDVVECLIQAKHHISPGSLTDKSEDLWKTLRIWSEQTALNPLFPIETKLVLLTTSTASEDTAMSRLRTGADQSSRDEALKKLRMAANSSKSESTQKGREAFLSLQDASQTALVNAIEVFDNSPNLIDMRDEIEAELFLSAPSHINLVANHLEGWWFSVVAHSLLNHSAPSIPVQNIVRKVFEVSEKLQRNELILADNLDEVSPDAHGSNEDALFVRQMRCVQLPDRIVERGVRDFYRAQAQRSIWARENLLLDGENAKFDGTLADQWARVFDEERVLNPTSSEDQKTELGRKICLWAQRQQIPFRNIVETWITAGSFHGLADRLEIGWHPDFRTLFTEDESKP